MTDENMLALTGSRTIAWNDELPQGLTALEVVFGRDETSVGEVQVAVAKATTRPTKGQLDTAWRTRGLKTAMPVVVAAVHADGVWLYDAKEDPLGPLPLEQAARQLQSVLDERDGIAAQQQIGAIQRAYSSIGAGGFANNFLFATYHLRVNVPRRPDWAAARELSAPLLTKRGKGLITALGFDAESVSNASTSTLILRSTSGSRRAVAVLLDESEQFDQKSPAYQLSPVAHGLEVAGREEVPWLIVLRQSTLRLYPGRDGVGVGQRGQSETFFELDLAFVDPEFAGLLSLIFSAEALEKGGSADQILDASGRYAADLGARLRDRVYLGVVPTIALAIADRLPQLGVAADAEGLKVAYALTLRILFRLLFQAYGEDSELLPARRNTWYDANSLQAFTSREMSTDAADFSDSATSIWQDLRQVWDAIFSGNQRWGVPAYGGSLFDPDTDEGALLKKLELPDSVLGPALQAMLTEVTEDGVLGPVDFRSLQVREFGTIYEGLLESSLSLADTDLAVNKAGAFVPAKDDDEVVAAAGTPYFHSASGERKATGSYFTPKIVVDHLIERSVAPALNAHLGKVRELLEAGKGREAATAFWDFRVADLAMGSAHFLVAAVDKIERGMRDFLTVTPVPEVRAELARLAEKAREALGDDAKAAEAITEAQLLRRQVARRCIYGLDINPLAVELSRLAIWIHTFVPGLPMSSLDHGLVLGNSLTGIGTVDEALDALDPKRMPGQPGFFDDVILDELSRAKVRLADFAAASEADRSEVAAGAKLLAEVKLASDTVRQIFDAAVAVRVGDIPPRALLTSEDVGELLANPAVAVAAKRLNPAHLPYLFPEVFLRENSGFDVLVGNPPWEESILKEDRWWLLHRPGLMAMAPAARHSAIENMAVSRPDLVADLEREKAARSALRKALLSAGFPGLGSSNVDLYQAFAWRFWRLIREGGRAGLVLPRGALSGSALSEWRREVLHEGSFADVCFLLNNQKWVFPSVHPQYTIALTVIERSRSDAVRISGPFASEVEFLSGTNTFSDVPTPKFVAWSSTFAFPLVPDATSAEILNLIGQSPTFHSDSHTWDLRPTRGDLLDASLFRLGSVEAGGPESMSVWAGATFNLWDTGFGPRYALADREKYRAAYLQRLAKASKNKRSAHYGEKYSSVSLPMDRPRIALRWITRATDSRTARAALIPSGTVTNDSASVFLRRKGTAHDEAFVLGIMCSIPFDWQVRRWVELNLTFDVLTRLAIPLRHSTSQFSNRIVEISGRLAASDNRYAEWAAEVGVEVGTANDEPVKSDLIAELDALVSLLYGLSEEQVEHVFATFHRGWKYQPRLDAVLAHYAAWKETE
ncbi:MAG: hypothetical protein KF692_01870 [Cryobacterium sp.]|nr:hypothetical protein [Cryobacterium sp.]